MKHGSNGVQRARRKIGISRNMRNGNEDVIRTRQLRRVDTPPTQPPNSTSKQDLRSSSASLGVQAISSVSLPRPRNTRVSGSGNQGVTFRPEQTTLVRSPSFPTRHMRHLHGAAPCPRTEPNQRARTSSARGQRDGISRFSPQCVSTTTPQSTLRSKHR